MFEEFIAQYYKSADEFGRELLDFMDACRQRARKRLDRETKAAFELYLAFHDWYVNSFSICGERKTAICRVGLSRRGESGDVPCELVFNGVVSLSISGELASAGSNYPGFGGESNISFAQISEVLLDYHDGFECILLLFDDRYIVIRCRDVRFRRNTDSC